MIIDGYINCSDRLPDNDGIYKVIGTVTTAYLRFSFIYEIEFRDGEWITPPNIKDGVITIGMWRP
jgi:hypothetical protein